MKSVWRAAGSGAGSGSLHVALAQQLARADGDLALPHLVAGAQGIGLRVEEGDHPLALVPLHAERPDARAEHEADQRRGDQQADADPATRSMPTSSGANIAAPPMSGSIATRSIGRPTMSERGRDLAQVEEAGVRARQIAGEEEGRRELRELRGLELPGAELEPVGGAAAHDAEEQDRASETIPSP